MMRRLLIVLVLASTAPCALAQEREPALSRTLEHLAFVLGESHALRQVCAGAGDEYWRTRMTEMVETEAPDEAASARLTAAFNAGFAARHREFPACDADSRLALAGVARHGHELSQQLASATIRVETPDPTAPLDPAADDVAPGASPR